MIFPDTDRWRWSEYYVVFPCKIVARKRILSNLLKCVLVRQRDPSTEVLTRKYYVVLRSSFTCPYQEISCFDIRKTTSNSLLSSQKISPVISNGLTPFSALILFCISPSAVGECSRATLWLSASERLSLRARLTTRRFRDTRSCRLMFLLFSQPKIRKERLK